MMGLHENPSIYRQITCSSFLITRSDGNGETLRGQMVDLYLPFPTPFPPTTYTPPRNPCPYAPSPSSRTLPLPSPQGQAWPPPRVPPSWQASGPCSSD